MDRLKHILTLFLGFFVLSVSAQPFEITGIITDSETKEPLPFVNIVINNSNHGGISDINGKFSLKSNSEIYFLRVSYVGYFSDTILLNKGQTFVELEMRKNAVELNEVVILPGENPAHRIIDSAIVH